MTDLDNTLFDWFAMWYAAFEAFLHRVTEDSGVPRDTLISEIRVVHQRRRTSEYSYLLNELPSLRRLHPSADIANVYSGAVRDYQIAREANLELYPTVLESLRTIHNRGVSIVAYTESLAFFSAWRLKKLGLDGLIDVLYSSPDHDFPEGITGQQLRSRSDDEYGLRSTKHAYTPPGIVKPNPGVLRKILSDEKVDPASTVYIGDSRMKDVLMAQEMGANDVLAVYGAVSDDRQYELLRSVSHWTAEDVERERQINARGTVVPTHAVQSFAELLSIFDFRAKDG